MTLESYIGTAMEFGMGALGWSEAVLWATSLPSYERAVAGYCKANGVGSGAQSSSGLTDADVKRLRAGLEEFKTQFPDKPA